MENVSGIDLQKLEDLYPLNELKSSIPFMEEVEFKSMIKASLMAAMNPQSDTVTFYLSELGLNLKPEYRDYALQYIHTINSLQLMHFHRENKNLSGEERGVIVDQMDLIRKSFYDSEQMFENNTLLHRVVTKLNIKQLLDRTGLVRGDKLTRVEMMDIRQNVENAFSQNHGQQI